MWELPIAEAAFQGHLKQLVDQRLAFTVNRLAGAFFYQYNVAGNHSHRRHNLEHVNLDMMILKYET